jgi:hypothetical protein
MIFTAEDAASLSKSLSRWEGAEYFFTFLVAIACAGEYVADFTNWFTGGAEELKRRLAKASTLLLIVALSLELTCLVRTNSLSGLLIGSLSDKAENAEKDAKQAIGDSAIAETQSGQAVIDAGKATDASTAAVRASGNAKTFASSALNLARGARQEADSFKKDIASAKTLAADAESHLANALQQAANATAELNRLKTGRSLSKEQQERIAAHIARFPGTPFDIWVSADSDSTALMELIDSVLRSANWKFNSTGNPIEFAGKAGIIAASGISIHVPEEHRSEWEPAVIALRNALMSAGIPALAVRDTDTTETTAKRDRIHVMIGSKVLD